MSDIAATPSPRSLHLLPSEIKIRIAQFVRSDDPNAEQYEQSHLRSLRLVDRVWNAVVDPLLFERHLHLLIIPVAANDPYWEKWTQNMRSAVFPLCLPTSLLDAYKTRSDSLDRRISEIIYSCSKLAKIHVAYHTMYQQYRTLSERLSLSIEAIISRHSVTDLSINGNCEDAKALAAQILYAMPQIKSSRLDLSPRELLLQRPRDASAQFTRAIFDAINLDSVIVSGPCLVELGSPVQPKCRLTRLVSTVQKCGSKGTGYIIYYLRNTLTSLITDIDAITYAKSLGKESLVMPLLRDLCLVTGRTWRSGPAALPDAPKLEELGLVTTNGDTTVLETILAAHTFPGLKTVQIHGAIHSASARRLSVICQVAGLTFEAKYRDETSEDLSE